MIRSLIVLQSALALSAMGVACGDAALSCEDQAAPGLAASTLASAQSAADTERFALIVRLPVHWPQNMGLVAGDGVIEHRVLLVRRAGSEGAAQDALTLCQSASPGYTTRASFGGESYAFTFEDAQLRDAAQAQLVHEVAEDGTPTRLGLVLGARLGDPIADAWPSGQKLKDVAAAGERGTLGITLVPTRTLPPVNRQRTRRARHFTIALRHAIDLELGADEHGTRRGSAQAHRAGSRTLIESTTLGCAIDAPASAAEGGCSSVELYLANMFAPSYRAEPGEAHLVRLPADGDCRAVQDLSL